MRTFSVVQVAVLSMLCAGSVLAQQAENPIHVAGARALVSPGAGGTAAIYMTISNTGGVAERLVSASTSAGKAELHATIAVGDVMRMRSVDAIDLRPGSEVELKPMGLHIMLTHLSAPLRAGTTLPITLTFDKGSPLTVDVPIQGAGHGTSMVK